MKKYLIPAALLGAVILGVSAKSTDPVLMRVGGRDVRLSEFEYLYHKNNSQQLEPVTLDQYVEMFADYKRKVADAEANGLDTMKSFQDELAKYCNDLARPYLRDQAVADSLLQVSYNHYNEDVKVSHIMIRGGQNAAEHQAAVAHLDSLRQAIVNGQITFEQAAQNESIDKGSAKRGGLMGNVIAGRYPWAFEDAAFNTPVGQISPVVNSGMGLHLIRVESRQPAKGEVKASHILKLTRDVAPEQQTAAKRQIDSIYSLLVAGADFAEMARRESQDPGSAKRAGDLGWFPAGAMVQPFDSISFALPDGALSQPFETTFGWHIIKRFEHRGVAPLEQMREQITRAMANDARGTMPEQRRLEQLMAQYKAKLDTKSIAKAAAKPAKAAKMTAFTIAGKKTRIGDVMTVDPGMSISAEALEAMMQTFMEAKVMDMARAALKVENADYRNLTNEYRDGILMYEISNRTVWERAAKDSEGLENFFRANRDRYKWDAPKYKAMVVFAATPEKAREAKAYADSLDNMLPVDIIAAMNQRFGRDIKIERVIAAKGENAITDYLGFGGEKPKPSGRWTEYFAIQGHVLDAPEEAIDVKGAVTTDYQTELEQQWLNALRAKYPAKIDPKVLETVK